MARRVNRTCPGSAPPVSSPHVLFPRRGHDFLRGIREIGGLSDRKTALGKELAPLFRVRAFDAHDDRHADADVFHGVNDAFGNHVATDDAAEDIDEDGTYVLV